MIYYLSDILMAVSVMIMYPLAFIPNPKNAPINFQYWAISCLIFLQSYILLQSYQHSSVKVHHKAKLNKEFLKFLYSDENILSLGLGRMVNRWKNQKIRNSDDNDFKLKEDLDEIIKRSLKEENIDETLFYFTLDNDQGILDIEELRDISKEKVDSLIERAKQNLQQTMVKVNDNNEANVDQDMVERRRQILRLIKT